MRGELAEGEPSAWLCLLDKREGGLRLRGRKLFNTNSWDTRSGRREWRRSSSLLRDGMV
jgi:hypothetical protein